MGPLSEMGERDHKLQYAARVAITATALWLGVMKPQIRIRQTLEIRIDFAADSKQIPIKFFGISIGPTRRWEGDRGFGDG